MPTHEQSLDSNTSNGVASVIPEHSWASYFENKPSQLLPDIRHRRHQSWRQILHLLQGASRDLGQGQETS